MERNEVIDVVTRREPTWLHDCLAVLDYIDGLSIDDLHKRRRRQRLAESIAAGVRPRVSAESGSTDLYGHPLDENGMAIVPISGSGTYVPPSQF